MFNLNMYMNEKDSIQQLKESIDNEIDLLLPSKSTRQEKLHSAIRHSAMDGGKRVRGILTLICSNIFPGNSNALAAAAAVECIHAYSLIHDDLPALDNSNTRRNKPSCHIAYDEATAILAGDALLTQAFKILSESYIDKPKLALKLIRILSSASSSEALISGQMEDIENEGKPISEKTLNYIHENKTAKLISASIEMGFCFSRKDKITENYKRDLGYHIGMAFQYVDDILDVQSNEITIGKPTGKDNILKKLTSIKVYGLSKTKEKVSEHIDEAYNITNKIGGQNKLLLYYINFLANRVM